MREPTEVLQVPRNADEETIRRAYRRLVKLYHPDLTQNRRKAERNSRKLEEVLEAYQVLLRRFEPLPPAPPTRSPRNHWAKPANRSAAASRATPRATASPRARPSGNSGTKAYGPRGTGGPPQRPAPDPHNWARYGELLVSSESAAIRLMAARTLGRLGRRAAFGYLKQAFRDRDDRVICEAVRSVGMLGVRQARDDLLALFSDGSAPVKHAILDCVESSQNLEDYGTLLRLALRDMGDDIRSRGLLLYSRYQRACRHAGR